MSNPHGSAGPERLTKAKTLIMALRGGGALDNDEAELLAWLLTEVDRLKREVNEATLRYPEVWVAPADVAVELESSPELDAALDFIRQSAKRWRKFKGELSEDPEPSP